MTKRKEQSYFNLEDSIGFLYIVEINDLFEFKQTINENICNDNIFALTIVCNSNGFATNTSKDKKEELYDWLNSLSILSIAVVDNECHGDLLELIFMCDIRLGGKNLYLRFPGDKSGFVFDFEERCQLLMGRERNVVSYTSLLNTSLHLNELNKQRLINKIIDFDDISNEVRNFINKMIYGKDKSQIKAILKCFNNYKHTGVNSSRYILLEEEAKQFCTLIVKEYFKKRT